MMADWAHRWVPDPVNPPAPWTPWNPYGPREPTPWERQQFDELMEILRQVKEMEDRLGGCPCEDESKMDFLKEIDARITAREQDET
jgi:hypothetical protein